MDFDGKVAVVTGGESGIGRASAIRLARGGAAVALTYHSDSVAGGAVVRLIQSAGGRAITLVAFDASCLIDDENIWLYHSLEDRILRRALVRRYV